MSQCTQINKKKKKSSIMLKTTSAPSEFTNWTSPEYMSKKMTKMRRAQTHQTLLGVHKFLSQSHVGGTIIEKNVNLCLLVTVEVISN